MKYPSQLLAGVGTPPKCGWTNNEQVCFWLRERVHPEGEETECPEHTLVGIKLWWCFGDWMNCMLRSLPLLIGAVFSSSLLCAHVALYTEEAYWIHPEAWWWSDLCIPKFQTGMRAGQVLLRCFRREKRQRREKVTGSNYIRLLPSGAPSLMALSLEEK